MDEFVMGASALRAGLTAALSAIEYERGRVIVMRNGRTVGALISLSELERLRSMKPQPKRLSAHENKWKELEARERWVLHQQAAERAKKMIQEARERSDPLAEAHAQLEWEEATAGVKAAMQEHAFYGGYGDAPESISQTEPSRSST